VVVSQLASPRDHEGGPNVAHGGWTAAILDELAGHALVIRDEFCVTGTLTVKFVRPIPIELPLLGRAEITGRERRKVFVSATLELAQTGVLVAEAQAVMIKRPAEHYSVHEQWIATQRGAGG
jgi:acyl-coenzyme A thioesterase PaaI-like protein